MLEAHGLKLNSGYLDEFLARCGVVQTRDGVPYLVCEAVGYTALGLNAGLLGNSSGSVIIRPTPKQSKNYD